MNPYKHPFQFILLSMGLALIFALVLYQFLVHIPAYAQVDAFSSTLFRELLEQQERDPSFSIGIRFQSRLEVPNGRITKIASDYFCMYELTNEDRLKREWCIPYSRVDAVVHWRTIVKPTGTPAGDQ